MGRLTPFVDDVVLAVVLLAVFALLLPGLLVWAVAGVAFYTLAKLWIFRGHLRRPAIGVEAMQGRVAVAVSDLAPAGHVDLDGELWRAESAATVRAGERVVVEAVDGLTLRVAPAGVAGPVRSGPSGSWLLAVARRLRRP